MPSALPPPVADYLSSHHVATLATQGPQGPWAAAVFYVNDDGNLLFLTSPSSRHGENLAHDARCAATIQEDYADWPQIKGIQMEGRVSVLRGEEELAARRLYGQKYPVIGNLAKAPAAIVKALAKVRWYRLCPERMYFIDNSQGFGKRREIDLS